VARTEIRITGYGGQGVVLSAYIVGRACAILGGRHATMIQSFGPEARGSACSATLVISASEVLYPYVKRPDVFVAMSSEGYDKYGDELKDDGILIFEQDLVHPLFKKGQPAFSIPSTRIAEGLGRSLVQNIVMVGFLTAVTGIASREEMREAVKASVPAGTEELNLKAFDRGFEYAQEPAQERVRAAEATRGAEAARAEAGRVAEARR
jgi:2-oxoglutarate ferredoxin oxidoreductase subunit gamma